MPKNRKKEIRGALGDPRAGSRKPAAPEACRPSEDREAAWAARERRQRLKRSGELALCGAIIAVLLAWSALAVLGSVDIDGTAKLFSGIEGSAQELLRHV
jgi:hypothetical protein